jgi:hypothetical protein
LSSAPKAKEEDRAVRRAELLHERLQIAQERLRAQQEIEAARLDATHAADRQAVAEEMLKKLDEVLRAHDAIAKGEKPEAERKRTELEEALKAAEAEDRRLRFILAENSAKRAALRGTLAGLDSALEVRGVLAVPITFPTDSKPKVAEAALKLLLSQHSSADGVTDESWLAARKGCHLYVKFAKPPQAVSVHQAKDIEVSEMVVVFPLHSTGYILVKSGGRVVHFTKYEAKPGKELQALLASAVPEE